MNKKNKIIIAVIILALLLLGARIYFENRNSLHEGGKCTTEVVKEGSKFSNKGEVLEVCP